MEVDTAVYFNSETSETYSRADGDPKFHLGRKLPEKQNRTGIAEPEVEVETEQELRTRQEGVVVGSSLRAGKWGEEIRRDILSWRVAYWGRVVRLFFRY